MERTPLTRGDVDDTDVRELQQKLSEALKLAEAYREAAKARSEELSRLAEQYANDLDTQYTAQLRAEIGELRAQQSRRAVRYAVAMVRPVAAPYRVLKRVVHRARGNRG